MANPHNLEFTRKAEDQLASLPTSIIPDVVVGIDKFAGDPYAAYRRAVPPAEFPGYLIHEIEQIESDDGLHIVKLFFHFGADETSVIIEAIGHVLYHRH